MDFILNNNCFKIDLKKNNKTIKNGWEVTKYQAVLNSQRKSANPYS